MKKLFSIIPIALQRARVAKLAACTCSLCPVWHPCVCSIARRGLRVSFNEYIGYDIVVTGCSYVSIQLLHEREEVLIFRVIAGVVNETIRNTTAKVHTPVADGSKTMDRRRYMAEYVL